MSVTESVALVLALHETTAKAFKVSRTGAERDAVWLHRSRATMSEPMGGFQRWGKNATTRFVTIHEFTLSPVMAQTLGLAA